MSNEDPGRAPASEGDPNPDFGGQRVRYPVSFELRIIYVIASGATLEEDALRILSARRASPAMPKILPASGTRYGRMAIAVTFADQDSMRAAYADLAALPCVKAVM
ncbi:MAG TPA: hypothetical protein PK625_10055 [Spirochaetales bacterium]|nr:DUF493 family protein [Spirochaetales bacterium]MBP7264278.1 DUF493 family protein [Spirochaetia bacterium]HPE37486.1 hypothetical protein [Spirochaetales bacterium]